VKTTCRQTIGEFVLLSLERTVFIVFVGGAWGGEVGKAFSPFDCFVTHDRPWDSRAHARIPDWFTVAVYFWDGYYTMTVI